MLSRFTKTNRIRSTIALVATYAFCLLAPHLALAMTSGTALMHCLTEISDPAHVHKRSVSPSTHTHADGRTHEHNAPPVQIAQHTHSDGSKHDHGKSADGSCCGLFCVSALHHDGVTALPAPPPRALANAPAQLERASRSPDRIYEPPIG